MESESFFPVLPEEFSGEGEFLVDNKDFRKRLRNKVLNVVDDVNDTNDNGAVYEYARIAYNNLLRFIEELEDFIDNNDFGGGLFLFVNANVSCRLAYGRPGYVCGTTISVFAVDPVNVHLAGPDDYTVMREFEFDTDEGVISAIDLADVLVDVLLKLKKKYKYGFSGFIVTYSDDVHADILTGQC